MGGILHCLKRGVDILSGKRAAELAAQAAETQTRTNLQTVQTAERTRLAAERNTAIANAERENRTYTEELSTRYQTYWKQIDTQLVELTQISLDLYAEIRMFDTLRQSIAELYSCEADPKALQIILASSNKPIYKNFISCFPMHIAIIGLKPDHEIQSITLLLQHIASLNPQQINALGFNTTIAEINPLLWLREHVHALGNQLQLLCNTIHDKLRGEPAAATQLSNNYTNMYAKDVYNYIANNLEASQKDLQIRLRETVQVEIDLKESKRTSAVEFNALIATLNTELANMKTEIIKDYNTRSAEIDRECNNILSQQLVAIKHSYNEQRKRDRSSLFKEGIILIVGTALTSGFMAVSSYFQLSARLAASFLKSTTTAALRVANAVIHAGASTLSQLATGQAKLKNLATTFIKNAAMKVAGAGVSNLLANAGVNKLESKTLQAMLKNGTSGATKAAFKQKGNVFKNMAVGAASHSAGVLLDDSESSTITAMTASAVSCALEGQNSEGIIKGAVMAGVQSRVEGLVDTSTIKAVNFVTQHLERDIMPIENIALTSANTPAATAAPAQTTSSVASSTIPSVDAAVGVNIPGAAPAGEPGIELINSTPWSKSNTATALTDSKSRMYILKNDDSDDEEEVEVLKLEQQAAPQLMPLFVLNRKQWQGSHDLYRKNFADGRVSFGVSFESDYGYAAAGYLFPELLHGAFVGNIYSNNTVNLFKAKSTKPRGEFNVRGNLIEQRFSATGAIQRNSENSSLVAHSDANISILRLNVLATDNTYGETKFSAAWLEGAYSARALAKVDYVDNYGIGGVEGKIKVLPLKMSVKDNEGGEFYVKYALHDLNASAGGKYGNTDLYDSAEFGNKFIYNFQNIQAGKKFAEHCSDFICIKPEISVEASALNVTLNLDELELYVGPKAEVAIAVNARINPNAEENWNAIVYDYKQRSRDAFYLSSTADQIVDNPILQNLYPAAYQEFLDTKFKQSKSTQRKQYE